MLYKVLRLLPRYCICWLLCTPTICTPHERLCTCFRKSSNGAFFPSWVKSGPMFLKRRVRYKTDPFVGEAELIEANPHYAHVRLDDGREMSVILWD